MPKQKSTAGRKIPSRKIAGGTPARESTVLEKKAVAEKPTSPAKQEPGFAVVGIGASAGGLEAMTDLLRSLPADLGMAFVLVPHLAPEHKSMMTELLAQETKLEVSEVTDGIKVAPNSLYVIPPNTDLGIINNTLHLMPRDRQKQHLPIDYFFQSLAADRGVSAIGIILSGSASDGTLGLKAIKSAAGITFAQATATARYESMPASAIAAGCVDFVLSPAGIARELAHIARHPSSLHADIADKEDHAHCVNELEKIFLLLRNRTGNDFSRYKHASIRRRIGRQMLIHKIDRLQDYVRYLSDNPAEVDALFQGILINVTSFFRDPDAFSALKTVVFPEIFQGRPVDQPVRVWVPSCSTGEEVYSIIILLLEYLEDAKPGISLQIFASDIDEQAIDIARAGIYPEGIVANVSAERLRRFFIKVPQGYQISKKIRDLCVFAMQNITKDPPFSHQDLIACRNMLIYMGTELQRKVMQTLHYALSPYGYLFLGGSETIGASADLFATVVSEHRIYKKKDVPQNFRLRPIGVTDGFPAPPVSAAKLQLDKTPVELQLLAESMVLKEYGPPGVVVNENLNVLQFIGQTGLYLDPAPGIASLNLIKLAHPALSVALRIATHNAVRDRKRVIQENIYLQHNDKVDNISIDIMPMPVPSNGERYYLILFHKKAEYDAAVGSKTATGEEVDRIKELEKELETNRNYMQSIIEEQESSNEEIQSTNEELQSTNEELQSTNEELETAKEELQSTNEELITVNEELENRNTELSTSNDDLHNLITSTDLPLVMLNETLNIRFFSPQAHLLLNLIDSDIGRPIGNIRPNVNAGNITEHARQVVASLKPLLLEVQDSNDRWYSMRICPYRTQDNRISGAVIVFIDITDSKMLQRASRLATVVEDSSDAITLQSFEGRILAWNRRASEIYGYAEDEALNASIEIVVPEDKCEEFASKRSQLRAGKQVEPFSTERRCKDGGRVKTLVVMSLLKNEHNRPEAIATTERILED